MSKVFQAASAVAARYAVREIKVRVGDACISLMVHPVSCSSHKPFKCHGVDIDEGVSRCLPRSPFRQLKELRPSGATDEASAAEYLEYIDELMAPASAPIAGGKKGKKEKKEDDGTVLSSVVGVCERAIAAVCLVPRVWARYLGVSVLFVRVHLFTSYYYWCVPRGQRRGLTMLPRTTRFSTLR